MAYCKSILCQYIQDILYSILLHLHDEDILNIIMMSL